MSRLPVIVGRLIIIILLQLIVGCSAIRLTYNNADILARYRMSDYVDLTSTQVDQFKQRFAALHQWHREHELPEYVSLLQLAGSRVARGVTAEDVNWAIVSLRMRYRLVASRAAEEAAPIFAGLDAGQLTELEKNFADNIRKFEKDNLEGDARRMRRKHTQKIEDNVTDWTGSLNDQQVQRVGRFVDHYISVLSLRLEDRRRWQRDMLSLLRAERNAASLAPRLAAMFAHPEAARTPKYQEAMNRYEAAIGELIVDLDRMLTPDQRVRAMRRMQRYEEDLAALAARKTASGSP